MTDPAVPDAEPPRPPTRSPGGNVGSRVALEEEVEHLRERMRLMVEAVRDYAIFMLDAEGRVRSWNVGAERLKGYRSEEILGQHFSVFYTDQDRDRGHPAEELRRAIADGRYEEEGWRVRRDGSQFWANVVITPFYDRQGRHVGFTKVTRDFTERRSVEERLRQSEERLRLLVESVKDYAIFMLDPTGRITTWNSGAQTIHGYRPQEIVGRHFSVFYLPEDVAARRPERELEIALAIGRYEEEGWRVRKDGQRFWASVVLTAVHDEGGEHRGFAKVTRDLSDRRRAEQEARAAETREVEARARALEAQKAVLLRDEFISVAAHELRTPLTALQLKLQGLDRALVQTPGPPSEPRVIERLEGASRQVKRLIRLVEELLDVPRIVGGRLRLVPEEVDLGALARAVVDDLAEPARHARSELRLRAARVVGRWDPSRLDQALINVISNAIKYGEGKPIDVEVEATDRGARCTVTDRGLGIAPEDRERIFGRFVRAAPSQHYGGLGLGLYLARSIVESHGGTIAVESVLGGGSRFTIELPLEMPASGVEVGGGG
jgi:PAS domain S-box-containing protein